MELDIDEKIPGAPHFSWKEALLLREWEIYVYPTEEVYRNIIQIAGTMEDIRRILGKPIHITSWYRPKFYNMKIGGSWLSSHKYGMAVDFKVQDTVTAVAREKLKGHLDILGIRMQDSNRSYIHIDSRMPNDGRRFFK